ncbi:MAG: thioredoxin family protein [Kiritimatiellia bacterium]
MNKLMLTGLMMLAGLSAIGAEPAVGNAAPDFVLPDINGATIRLADFKGKTIVLEWTNYECPFVKKHYDGGNMQELQKTYTGKGVTWLTISSSADGKQGFFDAETWKKMAAAKKAASTAILLDRDGAVGHLYGAKTTPHMFVIDDKGILVYKGAIDDKASVEAATLKDAKHYVTLALDAVLAGKAVETPETAPYGCSVKY